MYLMELPVPLFLSESGISYSAFLAASRKMLLNFSC